MPAEVEEDVGLELLVKRMERVLVPAVALVRDAGFPVRDSRDDGHIVVPAAHGAGNEVRAGKEMRRKPGRDD